MRSGSGWRLRSSRPLDGGTEASAREVIYGSSQTLYLWFPGNAAEALKFYQETFGGELTLTGSRFAGSSATKHPNPTRPIVVPRRWYQAKVDFTVDAVEAHHS